MKKSVRTIAICLTLAFSLLLQGCLFKKDPEGTKWSDGVMMRIGNQQIDYREGLVYLDATRRDYERYYGTDIWTYVCGADGSTLGDVVKKQVLDEVIYVKIVCAQAETLHVSLTGDELAVVDEQTDKYMQLIKGSDILKKGVNRDIVRKIYADNFLARKVFEQATLNIDTNISNEEAGQHHLCSIAVRNYKIGASGERVDYSADEKAELRARMETLKTTAAAEKDFRTFAQGVTEDSSKLDIYAGPGDLDPAIESQVLALQDGEISNVLETADWLYLFYCVTAFDVDKTLEKKEEIIAARQEEAFETFYAKWLAETEVEINEPVWEKMNFTETVQNETK